jgi:hypothetical protein
VPRFWLGTIIVRIGSRKKEIEWIGKLRYAKPIVVSQSKLRSVTIGCLYKNVQLICRAPEQLYIRHPDYLHRIPLTKLIYALSLRLVSPILFLSSNLFLFPLMF